MGSSIKNGTTSKNQEIELWRFFFAVMVFLSHMSVLPNGALAVDFFFLLTGYLTMNSIFTKRQRGSKDASSSSFIIHKIKSFYPELLVATVISIIVYFIANPINPHLLYRAIQTLINGIIPLKMTGIGISVSDFNGATWYISSMLLGLIIVYPLLLRYGTHPLLFITGVILCGFLCQYHGALYGVYKWYGITFEGNIRAVGELLLGATAFPVVERLRKLTLTKLGQYFISLIKYTGIGIIIIISAVNNKSLHGVALCCALLALILSFSNLGIDKILFRNKLCANLGALSLPLYLGHRAITVCCNSIVPFSDCPLRIKTLICFGYSLLSAFIIIGGAYLIRRITPNLVQLVIVKGQKNA